MSRSLRCLATLSLAATLCVQAAAQTPAPAQDRFLASLAALCGHAYEGKVTSSDAADADMAGSRLVMHVRSCTADEVRVPFHVGEDRSRTWVVSRTPAGLRLKHDHRHEDGSEDKLTQYGGDTVAPGTAERQEFPADAYSRAVFIAQEIPRSATNVWAMEIAPGQSFVYELRRPGRHFRVEFDLTRPVAPPPPPPWGAE